jgi:pimeloyl-ACP methyl ester carboxylesterase
VFFAVTIEKNNIPNLKVTTKVSLFNSMNSELIINYLRFAVKKWGDPEEIPVVALHGWRDNANTFDTLAPLFNFNFIAIDFPGHGLSSHAKIGNSSHWIDTLHQMRYVFKYFGYKKVSLIGHSFGSTASIGYAGLYPDEVDRYVSIECGRAKVLLGPKQFADYWGPHTDRLLKMESLVLHKQTPEYSYEEILERYQKGAFMSPTLESTQILMERGASPSKTNPGKYTFNYDPRVLLQASKLPPKEVLFALLKNTKCKVMNIYAKPGFGCPNEKNYFKTLEILKESAASLEVHEILGSHHVHINNPERIAPLINNFITSK